MRWRGRYVWRADAPGYTRYVWRADGVVKVTMGGTFMRAVRRTLAIGAIMVNLVSFGSCGFAAHASSVPAAGLRQTLYRQVGALTSPAQARLGAPLFPTSAAPTCQASQLSITPDLSSGATGHIGVELRLHNVSAHPCTLKGYATIVLLDGSRRPLLTVLHWGPGGFFNFNRPVRLVTLAPGGNAYLAMGWAHIPSPGQTCPPAPNLLVLPPGASSALLVPMGHPSTHTYGSVDACGGQLSIAAVEPTHFLL